MEGAAAGVVAPARPTASCGAAKPCPGGAGPAPTAAGGVWGAAGEGGNAPGMAGAGESGNDSSAFSESLRVRTCGFGCTHANARHYAIHTVFLFCCFIWRGLAMSAHTVAKTQRGTVSFTDQSIHLRFTWVALNQNCSAGDWSRPWRGFLNCRPREQYGTRKILPNGDGTGTKLSILGIILLLFVCWGLRCRSFRGTSLTGNNSPVGPYSSPMIEKK